MRCGCTTRSRAAHGRGHAPHKQNTQEGGLRVRTPSGAIAEPTSPALSGAERVCLRFMPSSLRLVGRRLVHHIFQQVGREVACQVLRSTNKAEDWYQWDSGMARIAEAGHCAPPDRSRWPSPCLWLEAMEMAVPWHGRPISGPIELVQRGMNFTAFYRRVWISKRNRPGTIGSGRK